MQEHFLLRDNLYKLSDKFPDYETFSIPATKSNDKILCVRPSGGLSILWKRELNGNITRINNLSSKKFQGFILKINSIKYLIINSYFHVDPELKCLMNGN